LTLLVGSCGVGKTTLARKYADIYLDLKFPTQREWLLDRLTQVLHGKKRLVLDGVETMPELFPILLDELYDSKLGPYRKVLLISSIAPSRLRHFTPEVAKHTSIAPLSPLLLDELGAKGDIDRLWFYGGYPEGGIFLKRNYSSWHQGHLKRLAEEELPRLGMPLDSQLIELLFEELAKLHGRSWNASSIARVLDSDHRKVDALVDFLADTFLVRRLPAYTSEINKRLVRKPIIYLRDSGLWHSLLGLNGLNHLHEYELAEISWKGFVIEQLLAFIDTQDVDYKASHFGTSSGDRIDLVLEIAGNTWAFQITTAESIDQKDTAHLKKTADMIDANYRVIVARIQQPVEHENHAIANLRWLLDEFKDVRLW